MTKKRFGCLRILLICGLLLIGLIAFWAWMNFTGGPKDGKPLVFVSPETTVIAEPLDENGDPDYIEYLNRQLSAGITPENNAAEQMIQALGPTLNGRTISDEYYRRLGIEPLPIEGDYWIEFSEWKAKVPQSNSELTADEWDELLSNQYDFAIENPWTVEQLPELAQWFKQNRAALELVRQATLRPRFYAPLIDDSEVPTLLGVDWALLMGQREFTRALSISAMKQLGENDAAAAFADSLALRRLARLSDQQPSTVDALMANAIELTGTGLETRIAASGKATKQQLLEYRAQISQLPPLKPIYDRLDKFERFMVLDAMRAIGRGELTLETLVEPDGEGQDYGLFDTLIFSHVDWTSAMLETNRLFDMAVEVAQQEVFLERMDKLYVLEMELANALDQLKEPSMMAASLVGGRGVRGTRAGKVLCDLMMPELFSILVAETRAIVDHRFSLTAISLELYKIDHGEYPESLDALVPEYCDTVPLDSFVEEPLRYKRTEEKYLLYSVYRNLGDDLGLGFDDIGSDGDDWSAKVTTMDWQQFQQELLDRKAEFMKPLEFFEGDGNDSLPEK